MWLTNWHLRHFILFKFVKRSIDRGVLNYFLFVPISTFDEIWNLRLIMILNYLGHYLFYIARRYTYIFDNFFVFLLRKSFSRKWCFAIALKWVIKLVACGQRKREREGNIFNLGRISMSFCALAQIAFLSKFRENYYSATRLV